MAESAWCVRCKGKRDMSGTSVASMKNGRRYMRGVCTKCGTKMVRIMSGK